MNLRIRILFSVLALALLAGCGAVKEARQAARQTQMKNNLRILGMTYHSHHDAKNVGPAGWDELIAFANEGGGGAEEIQLVKDAGYEVVWGQKFSDLVDGMANTKMATHPSGGPVLMFDGSVQ